MSQYSALYDELGPRSVRLTRIITLIVALALVAVASIATMRLFEQGQLATDKWSSLFNPADPQFSIVWTFLLGGLGSTALAGLMAIVFSLVLGTLLGLTRLTARPSYRWAVVGTMETLRAVPVVISIFFVSRALPIWGIDLPLLWYLVIGLTVYNSIAIAEIVRAGILAVPHGQSEAGAALGFSGAAAMRLVILPQAFRLMLPVLISQIVIVIKDTALGFIIGFEELLRRGEIAVQTLHNPLQMYLLIGIIFFLVNYALSRVAEQVEKRAGATITLPWRRPRSKIRSETVGKFRRRTLRQRHLL